MMSSDRYLNANEGGGLQKERVIEVSDLSCAFGSASVFSGVNFSVGIQEKVALVGANGVGKSTLLRCLAGILDCHGAMKLFGQPRESLDQKTFARRVSYLPQTSENLPDFTVIEFLRLSRYPFHTPFYALSNRENDLIDETVAWCELSALVERPLGTLSGGERQRVLLAGCFCQEAELLLLDEPANALDLAHQDQFYHMLEHYSKKRTVTSIIVGHDLNRVSLWADRIICIKNGGIFFDGTPMQFMKYQVLKDCIGGEFSLVLHPEKDLQMVLPR